MAEATLAGFRSRFPTFSTTADPDVMNALDEAMIIHNVRALATLYLVAHFLTIDAQVKAGTASRGELSSAGAGPLRAEYVTQAESKGRGAGSRDAAFTRTEFGRRFLSLEKRTPRSAIGARVAG